ncbi:MAG TPA: hypothetical protein VNX21_09685 [Candidatus Thermoplasmatota archaeon]|nr:hypothetical protein [Candidatus Thermoplasmatota archaeon]
MKPIVVIGFALSLALVSAPGVVAHDTHCGGGAITGGACLIVCGATHPAFPGSSHKCTYTASYYCDVVSACTLV